MGSKYLLVDFENVQPKNVGLLNGKSLKVKIFLGTQQAKIPLEIEELGERGAIKVTDGKIQYALPTAQ